MRLPIREYADRLGVSIDTVRRRIRTGSLEAELENGKWWVLVDEESIPLSRATKGSLEELVAELRNQLRVKDEQIARLLDLLHQR